MKQLAFFMIQSLLSWILSHDFLNENHLISMVYGIPTLMRMS